MEVIYDHPKENAITIEEIFSRLLRSVFFAGTLLHMDPIYERFLRDTAKRNAKIIAARNAGLTVVQIAKAYDISPQRVSKICEPLRKVKAK